MRCDTAKTQHKNALSRHQLATAHTNNILGEESLILHQSVKNDESPATVYILMVS